MTDPAGGREAEIRVVRAYFRKIGLAGPTVAQAEQVITALDEAGMLRSSGSAARNQEETNGLRAILNRVIDGMPEAARRLWRAEILALDSGLRAARSPQSEDHEE